MSFVIRIFLAAAALSAGASVAAAAPEQGRSYVREMEIGGKFIPLPPGEWTVAGAAAGTLRGGTDPGAYGLIRNVVLLRRAPDGGAVDAMIEVNANDLAVADGWGTASSCSRTDVPLGFVRYKAGWDSSCFFITHTLWDSRAVATPAWTQAAAFAAAKGWSIPAHTVTSGFRVSNRRDVLDVRVHFAPAFYGIAEPPVSEWSQSPWHASRLEGDPRRLAFAKSLTEWTVLFSGHVEAGMKRRAADDAALPNPGVDAGAAARADIVAKRMKTLETLKASGFLTEGAYRDQVKVLEESGLDPTSTSIDPSTIALYKTLAYRPTVSVANIFIDYYWIGNPFATGVLLLLQVTINSFKFYFHELAWQKFVSSSGRSDSVRVIDFVHGGIDG